METTISYNSSINFGIQGGAIRIPFTPYANCRAIVCSRYVQLCERAPDRKKEDAWHSARCGKNAEAFLIFV